MNLNIKDSVKLVKELKKLVKGVSAEVLVCPSFTALKDVYSVVKGSNIKLGAQNICYSDKGAFTGEVSASMLKEVGCSYVIIGHSERRHVFNEDDLLINKRVLNALENNLKVILCVGETLEERGKGKTKQVVVDQIKKGLKDVDNINNVVIAYEPVWAISGGDPNHKAATSADTQEAHVLIRDLIQEMYSLDVSVGVRIIYGGSAKPDNIQDLMMQSDIDGALVGGASLDSDSFSKIVKY